MSATDATLAARSRRHRERAAARQVDVLEAIGAMRADLAALTRAVESLAGALRNGGASTVDASVGGGGKPARKPRNSPDSVAQREGARARVGTPPPPTGVVVASVRDDAWRVARVLTAPASAGGIRDALSVAGPGWPLERITAALVFLQGQGQVTRSPGEGGRPDRWIPVREDDPPQMRPPRPESTTAHVACSDYAAHTAGHRWDGGQGRFRCELCEPTPMAPGPPVPPPAVQGPPRRQDVPAPVAPGGP